VLFFKLTHYPLFPGLLQHLFVSHLFWRFDRSDPVANLAETSNRPDNAPKQDVVQFKVEKFLGFSNIATRASEPKSISRHTFSFRTVDPTYRNAVR